MGDEASGPTEESPSDRLLAVLAWRTAEGWPAVLMPRGMPVRGDYLPSEFEGGHVRRDVSGRLVLRLIDAGDRLAFWLPDVGGALVNPKGLGLRAVGLVVIYARGSAFHEAAFKTADLRKGRPVDLRREPNSPHDTNAVAMHAPSARQPFGYVQRRRAASIARRLDAGEALAGVCLSGPGPRRADDSASVVIGTVDDLLTLAGADD